MTERVTRDGITPQGRGSWRITVAGGRDPETGRYIQIRETVRGTKTDARRRRDEIRADVARGTAVRRGPETVADYLDRYLAHREAIGKIRPKTALVYRGYVRREVIPRIGTVRLADVRSVHVQRVLDEALDRGLSARSVLQIHRIMHAAFRQAVRWNALTLNPSDGVTPPEARAPKTITPTPAQIRSLIAQADESFRAPLQLAAHTGMRRGELLATRWEDVSLDGAYPHVLVRGSLQRIGGVLEIVAPKTERAHRRIPLSHSAVSLLRSVRREQSERRLLVGGAWHDEGLVFDRYDGQPLDPDALTHAFQAARRRAKLEGVRLHDLRHAWATEQMRAQTNPRIVSDALGHATVAFTMQAYSHPDERMAHAAAEAIEAAFRE